MNNQDTNVNQYNGLLKEQEKPQMGNAAIPEPILGNTVVNQKPNDFFPSLEDQPLNTEVPMNNMSGAMPMTPPPIDMSIPQSVSSPVEMPQMNAEPAMPVTPEIPQFGPAPAPSPVEMPQMNTEPAKQANNIEMATIILKDVLPLLKHSGYKVILEESDTPQEHLITFKIQK